MGSVKVKVNLDRSLFNEKYIPYLNSDARYNIFYGGSSSGKSYFVASKMVIDLFKQKMKLLVVRQTFADIKESVFAELVSALEKLQLLKFVKISKTTLKMSFPNGSEIIFKGADEESKLLSINGIDRVWVEEASEITKELFNQLELRLRGKGHKKQFYLTFNPISNLHWLKDEFFDNPKDDTLVCHSTYLDNLTHLDEGTVNQFEDMKKRNFQKYEIYALGKWGTTGKKVFDNWKVNHFDVNQLIKDNHNLESAFGMDFGFNDPTTLICSLVDLEARKIYIHDEMYQKGILNNELAQIIIEKGYQKQLIVADSASPQSIAELKNYGLYKIKGAKKVSGSIMQGIQFIQQFDVIIHPSCIHTIEEFENYCFVKDKLTGQYLNKPIDTYNHLIDAFRYSLERFNSKNKIKFMNKSLLGL